MPIIVEFIKSVWESGIEVGLNKERIVAELWWQEYSAIGEQCSGEW